MCTLIPLQLGTREYIRALSIFSLSQTRLLQRLFCQFGQAFLELNLFYLACVPVLNC